MSGFRSVKVWHTLPLKLKPKESFDDFLTNSNIVCMLLTCMLVRASLPAGAAGGLGGSPTWLSASAAGYGSPDGSRICGRTRARFI